MSKKYLPVPTPFGEVKVRFRRRKRMADDKTTVEALYYDFFLNGKRYRGSTETTNERVANAVARTKVDEAAQSAGKVSGPGLTLSAAIDAYLDLSDEGNGRWKGKDIAGDRTYQDAKSRLEAFEKDRTEIELTGMPVENATTILQTYIDKRTADGISGRTIVNDRLVVGRFFKWLIGRRRVTWKTNPVATITSADMPTTEEKDPDPLDESIEPDVLTHARKSEVWPCVVLCLGCGTRPAEASRVTWPDINFKAGEVRVINKKGKKKRTREATMSAWAVEELKAWKESHPDYAQPFPYNSFTAFDMVADVRKDMAKARKDAQLDPLPESVTRTVTLQSMRQRACTRAIEQGMELSDYVQQFGHSLTVAGRHYIKYSHAAKERRSKAMDRVSPVKQETSKSVTQNVTREEAKTA